MSRVSIAATGRYRRRRADRRAKVVVASMTAHGTGKNLQHFQHQFPERRAGRGTTGGKQAGEGLRVVQQQGHQLRFPLI